jgi:epsilon-lactone hydrolase
MSLRLQLAKVFLRYVGKRFLMKETDPARMNARLSSLARTFRTPALARYARSSMGEAELPVLWATTGGQAQNGVILFLHGGGYIAGTPEIYKEMLASLAGSLGCEAAIPEYRMPPDHPFPTAFDDAVTCYLELLEKGYAPDRIILGGDSAGGGLMLALLSHICVRDLPRPVCAFALSPWTDLTLSGESFTKNQHTEDFLPASRIRDSRKMYLDGAAADDPRASPLFAEFPNCPPVLLHAGGQEILLDDTLRMQDHLLGFGTEVDCRVWPDTPHVWHLMQGRLPEADEALQDIVRFAQTHLT